MKEVSDFMKTRKAYVGTDGKFLYDIGTDTVSIVLNNMTGDPEVIKGVAYREEETSEFTHYGKRYNINKVFEKLIEGRTQPLLLKLIEDQIPAVETLDPARYAAADSSIPCLAVMEGDDHETAKYWLVDGNHRAAKAKAEGKHWIRVYYVSEEVLAGARVK